MNILICYHCKNEIGEQDKISIRDVCPNCSAYLHCCMNCRFYDKFAPHQCRINNVEPVAEKQKYNFCDDFKFTETRISGKGRSKEDALKKWNSLFKKN